MITNQDIKHMAKADWKEQKKAVFKATLLFLVLALIITVLTQNLSGLTRIAEKMMAVSEEMMQNPTLMFEPTPEFEEKVNEALNYVPKIEPLAYLLLTVLLIMQAMLNAGYEGYCLGVIRHKEQRAKDIMCSFEFFGKALAILIIRAVFTAIGFSLFIFPGIIVHYALSQSFMVMFDHPEYSAFQCLGESMKLMRGHKMRFFKLQFSFLGWHLLSSLVMSLTVVNIMVLYTKPYVGISQAHFYNLIAHPEMHGETRSADNEQ